MKCTPTITRILDNNRYSMRECALNWRRARQQGKLAGMTKWLLFATLFRRLNHGYLEAL